MSADYKVWGVPLKYLSLAALTIQNSAVTIVMHQSRIVNSPSKSYFAPSAVLLSELLKGFISLIVALRGIDRDLTEMEGGGYAALGSEEGRMVNGEVSSGFNSSTTGPGAGEAMSRSSSSTSSSQPQTSTSVNPSWTQRNWRVRLSKLYADVFSSDCWKLSIPAVLYVLQNNLQFVAASNLDPTTFQVAYQLKILTTALFSVLLLRRKLGADKWAALVVLAVGVGIVQIQAREAQIVGSSMQVQSYAGGGVGSNGPPSVGPLSPQPPPMPPSPFDSHRSPPPTPDGLDSQEEHVMDPLKGFFAVITACVTSGLAGVYFEKVLKASSADLWIRNVQLSTFSLIPAIAPVFLHCFRSGVGHFANPFQHFGLWAFSTVGLQVAGGLVTAIVIKYADNILKGFAVSFSIVLSFIASIAFFGYRVTLPFILGATLTISSTLIYNRPSTTISFNPNALTDNLSRKVHDDSSRIHSSNSNTKGHLHGDSSSSISSPRLGERVYARKHGHTNTLDTSPHGIVQMESSRKSPVSVNYPNKQGINVNSSSQGGGRNSWENADQWD